MGNLGWGEKDSGIWRGSQKISNSKVPQVDPCLWKKSEWEDTNEEVVGSYNKGEGRVCTEKEEDVSIVEKRERKDIQVHQRKIEERVY